MADASRAAPGCRLGLTIVDRKYSRGARCCRLKRRPAGGPRRAPQAPASPGECGRVGGRSRS
jgi:hypothetical protein